MKSQLNFNKDLAQCLSEMFSNSREYVNFIMVNLHLGYEAAYRRSKGEVSFTFHEIIIIAKKLRLSLDSLMKCSYEKSARFDISVIPSNSISDYIAYYESVFVEPYENFAMLSHAGKVLFTLATHVSFPPIFLLPYKHLTRFNLFQWVYHFSPESVELEFKDIQFTEVVIKKQNRIFELMTSAAHLTTSVLSKSIIPFCIEQINYFKDLGAFTQEDLSNIKSELIMAINDLEKVAKFGRYPLGNRVELYLSDIDFMSNYIYIKGLDFEQTMIDIYMFHTIESNDPFFINMHKKWIESQKKYSTLLSGISGVARSRYFKSQIKLIEEKL